MGANPDAEARPERAPVTPPDPLAAAARMAADWVLGVGFLRLHAAVFAVAGAALLFVDLIVDPADPWALGLLRGWLVLLGTHLAALVAGWVTWRAIRPDRLAASPLAWFLASAEDEDEAAGTLDADGHGQPLPATGRFTPGRLERTPGEDDAQGGIAAILAVAGDAVLDLVDLARVGVARTRAGIARGIDWVRNEDDEEEDEGDDSSGPPRSASPSSATPPGSPDPRGEQDARNP